jgi:hypothetical protein
LVLRRGFGDVLALGLTGGLLGVEVKFGLFGLDGAGGLVGRFAAGDAEDARKERGKFLLVQEEGGFYRVAVLEEISMG